MTTLKRITDLSEYTNVLPYASELFGVYQPLLGWNSKRLKKRFNDGFQNDRSVLLRRLKDQFSDLVNIVIDSERKLSIGIKPGVLKGGGFRATDSLVLERISIHVAGRLSGQDEISFEHIETSVWTKTITSEIINSILKDVVTFYTEMFDDKIINSGSPAAAFDERRIAGDSPGMLMLNKQIRYESSIAGALLYLTEKKKYHILEKIFITSKDRTEQADALIKMITAENSSEAFLDIEDFDPTEQEQLKGVTLSPISVVHLFRQYFFELDTFLGTPESHVWLSPGSSVEIIEEQTRRSRTEKTFESTLDIFTKSETENTIQDEISDAVSEENSKSLNLGASVTATYTDITATASFNYESSQNNAREKTHKSMREQTQKLSSEIRKNYKSTFKTVTELTDFSSTKHLLNNKTDKLINYELRRKMRQVGVQVQDIGTYLCWQTYVDDPGRELGLAKLVHIAQSAELDGLQHPEEILRLKEFTEKRTVTIPFIAVNDEGAGKDEMYVNGVESDGNNEGKLGFGWFGSGDLEKIQAVHSVNDLSSPKSHHKLTAVEFDPLGNVVTVSLVAGTLKNNNGKASFALQLDSVNFEGQNSIQIELILHWSPDESVNIQIDEKNKENIANFKTEEKAAYESAFLETVKDRINAVSNITTRNKADLREEERIVIYRKLIQDFLQNKISLPDDKTRHVVAELINSIFDVDKMLYFVAPEWWRPRLHKSKQQLHETSANSTRQNNSRTFSSLRHKFTERFKNGIGNAMAPVSEPSDVDPGILVSNTAGWGDINDTRRDNYYITEESTPAKFGSSLGWLMQLDGDNRRNAFLNAPWVKAVMPIRPGKEKAAINWLKAVEGMNGITDDVIYRSNNPDEKDINDNPLDGQKLIDVLMDLAAKIEKKHKEGLAADEYPKKSEVSDPALVDEGNTVTATPVDRVYEHGFFPLENSFRANIGNNYEIFDQWVEILPTDQTVPVEVEYDPKTGRQV